MGRHSAWHRPWDIGNRPVAATISHLYIAGGEEKLTHEARLFAASDVRVKSRKCRTGLSAVVIDKLDFGVHQLKRHTAILLEGCIVVVHPIGDLRIGIRQSE